MSIHLHEKESHVITNSNYKIKTCDVLPTPEISDHDAVFVCLNNHVARFEPRYKIIRDMKNFDLQSYVQNAATLPFNLVYATDSAYESLDNLKKLLLSCIERHAPLKRIKITRPQAPCHSPKNLQREKIQGSSNSNCK